MTRFTIEHEIPCSADTYWGACFFSDAFNHGAWVQTVGFPGWSQQVQAHEGGLRRTVAVLPKLAGVPKPILRLVGDSVGFEEHGEFDAAAGVYRFRSVPSVFAERCDIRGTLRVTALSATACLRTWEMQAEYAFPMLGGLMERTTVRLVTAFHEQAHAFERAFCERARAARETSATGTGAELRG